MLKANCAGFLAIAMIGCGSGGSNGATGGGGGGGTGTGGGNGTGGGAATQRRVFISSALLRADLRGAQATGVEGADATCRALAQAAGLPGAFVAFLTSPQSPVLTRLTAEGPWSVGAPDGGIGVEAFASRATLNSALSVTVNVDESGRTLFDTDVWTGKVESCSSWTSNSANEIGTAGCTSFACGARWQDFGVFPCSTMCRLLCFQN